MCKNKTNNTIKMNNRWYSKKYASGFWFISNRFTVSFFFNKNPAKLEIFISYYSQQNKPELYLENKETYMFGYMQAVFVFIVNFLWTNWHLKFWESCHFGIFFHSKRLNSKGQCVLKINSTDYMICFDLQAMIP